MLEAGHLCDVEVSSATCDHDATTLDHGTVQTSEETAARCLDAEQWLHLTVGSTKKCAVEKLKSKVTVGMPTAMSTACVPCDEQLQAFVEVLSVLAIPLSFAASATSTVGKKLCEVVDVPGRGGGMSGALGCTPSNRA